MNHLAIAPVLLPLLAGIMLLVARRFDLRLRRLFSIAAVLGQIGLAVMLLRAVGGGDILTYALGNWPAPYGIVLVADRLAAWMLLVTALLAVFPLLHACRGEDARGRHFHVLFQLQLFGLNGAFLTGDLFNLFVFFEVLLLASYGLILHGGGRLRSKAGLHYVVLNLAGSSLFLIAVGTLYGLFGTLNMADLAVKMAAVPAENLGPARAAGLLLFAVFALKAALLPLRARAISPSRPPNNTSAMIHDQAGCASAAFSSRNLPMKPDSGGRPASRMAVTKNRPPSSGAPTMAGAGSKRSPASPRAWAMCSASRNRAAAAKVE